jgi:hypothetical protein
MADVFDRVASATLAPPRGDVFDRVAEPRAVLGRQAPSGDIFDRVSGGLPGKVASFVQDAAKATFGAPALPAVGVEAVKDVFDKVAPAYDRKVTKVRERLAAAGEPVARWLTATRSGTSGETVDRPEAAKTLAEGAARFAIPDAFDLVAGVGLGAAGKAASGFRGAVELTDEARHIGRELAAIGRIAKNNNPLNGSVVPPPSKTAVEKVVTALREAKPVREQQEALYTEARAKLAARIERIGKEVPGEEGYAAQLAALKGELPKVQFQGVRNQLTQEDVTDLFGMIETHPMPVFDKITAKRGLTKLLGKEGGVVPTRGELELLSEVFPGEFVEAVLSKRSTWEKIVSTAGDIINIPRAAMSTLDLSAPLRQGAFLVGRPDKWGPAFKDMFRYAFSEEAYQGLLTRIKSRPTYKAMRAAKLDITELSSNLGAREEAFMSNILERIPVVGRAVRGSARAYSGFLNQLRADVFDDLYSKAVASGVAAERPQVVEHIARYVNAATGRGSLGKLERAGVLLNGTFFSPRLLFSRLNLLNPAFYVKLDPAVRKEALRDLFTFTSAGTTAVSLAALAGADVSLDPRNADFGKVRIGNTRYDVWGGFQQPVVLASRLLTNQMVSSTTGRPFTFGEGFRAPTRLDAVQRFLEGKMAPVMSFAIGLARGKDPIGRDFEVLPELGKRMVPIVLQDTVELMKEWGPMGLAGIVPAVFGVGSQTYSGVPERPARPRR